MAMDAVGPRLRALRKKRTITLEQLAERTGISISTLSRLESGRRRPTLELLFALAQEYRVPLDELVGAPQVADPRIHPRPIRRNGTTWLALTRNQEGFNAFKQIVPVGHVDTVDQRTHPGYEWLYVLSGSLRLALADEVFDLTAGEAAEFDTTVPHAIANQGAVAVEVLIIYSQNGERLHMHGALTDPSPSP
jgi:transcriptional regulator with XRE-family HTH domain